MQFYKALDFLMNTANNKIKRKCWPDGFYLTKEYDQISGKYWVIMNFHDEIGNPLREHFSARSEELISEDWVVL